MNGQAQREQQAYTLVRSWGQSQATPAQALAAINRSAENPENLHIVPHIVTYARRAGLIRGDT